MRPLLPTLTGAMLLLALTAGIARAEPPTQASAEAAFTIDYPHHLLTFEDLE